MKRRRAYRAIGVNRIDWRTLAEGREGQEAIVGTDIGKYEMMAMVRWSDGDFERPWLVDNPGQIHELVALLKQAKQAGGLVVSMEPSGTYGDALRQALDDAHIEVRRVSPKAAHDYAEVFDGVPSQHDGKDAAVVAELTAIGKSSPWHYEPRSAWEEELVYWVEGMEAQRRIAVMWLGRIEALLSRHWPEATRVLKLSSATLLRALATYSGPAALAADAQAAARLARWGGKWLSPEKVDALLVSARTTVGVRQGEWEKRRLREYAQRARAAKQEFQRSQRQLRRLTKQHAIIQAQGKVVGVPTACVLWVCAGDPRAYHSGGAYRKAMGLNLVERSSGTYKGALKISKRGDPRTRRWLYLAALRQVKAAGVQQWYQAKKAKDGNEARRALVGVMRKLALALYQVGAHGARFHSRRLFAKIVHRQEKSAGAITKKEEPQKVGKE